MSKSTYKKWIKESFLYEVDKYGSKSIGKEDGDTWVIMLMMMLIIMQKVVSTECCWR